jgi:hypothetical protein
LSLKRALAIPVAFAIFIMLAAPAFAATPLTISTTGGTLYFPGENAVVYFTTTANGVLVNPDTTTVTLYLPNNANSFTLSATNVGTGVFYANYTLPATALSGFYAVVITASYQSGSYIGTVATGFEVSQGLINQQNSILAAIGGLSNQISSVESNILSAMGVVGTSLNSTLGSVKASMTSADSTLTGAITASQNAVTSAVSQSQTNIQSSVSAAQSSISSSLASSIASLTSSNTTSFNNITNYEYYIMALTAIVLICTIVILVLKRK